MQPMQPKIQFLQNLVNTFGDYKISHNYTDDKGQIGFTKHKSMMQCWENLNTERWRIEKATHRTILPNEIVLDIDAKQNETPEKLLKRFQKICDSLETATLDYFGFSTGSKGYHIHIFFTNLDLMPKYNRELIREKIIKKFGGELLKKSEGTMIALEFYPHWKSGKNKSIIRWKAVHIPFPYRAMMMPCESDA